jgi:hypothetical protein
MKKAVETANDVQQCVITGLKAGVNESGRDYWLNGPVFSTNSWTVL